MARKVTETSATPKTLKDTPAKLPFGWHGQVSEENNGTKASHKLQYTTSISSFDIIMADDKTRKGSERKGPVTPAESIEFASNFDLEDEVCKRLEMGAEFKRLGAWFARREAVWSQSFADALVVMNRAERKAALEKHYAGHKDNPWTKAKGDNPTPQRFREWLDAVFPDRREIGMVLSDLNHLDHAAYKKIMNWTDPDSGVSRTEIESFGLPSRIVKYDPQRDADAPKSMSEVYARAERGEDFRKLQRSFGRTRYHK